MDRMIATTGLAIAWLASAPAANAAQPVALGVNSASTGYVFSENPAGALSTAELLRLHSELSVGVRDDLDRRVARSLSWATGRGG